MEKFFKNMREYWFIIIFIGMVIVSWTTFSNRLQAVENDVADLKRAISTFEQVRTDIAVIKEKITNIEKKI